MQPLDAHALESLRTIFRGIRQLGAGALAQCDDAAVVREPAPGANSIAVIVNHLRGNMLSRWTDFLSADGEKPWRDRDAEFEPPAAATREAVAALYEEGWDCVFRALDALEPADLLRTVTIRGQAHSVLEACNRQVQHYAYHIGQIVLLSRIARGADWATLSIARGASKAYTPGRGAGESGR